MSGLAIRVELDLLDWCLIDVRHADHLIVQFVFLERFVDDRFINGHLDQLDPM